MKCVAMHTNYSLYFKVALYSSTLVIKLLNNSRKLFKAEIITYVAVKLKASFF